MGVAGAPPISCDAARADGLVDGTTEGTLAVEPISSWCWFTKCWTRFPCRTNLRGQWGHRFSP